MITLSGQSALPGVTVITYDKAIYDLSGSPTGTPRTRRDEHVGRANYHQSWRADPAADADSHSMEHERGHHPINLQQTSRKLARQFCTVTNCVLLNGPVLVPGKWSMHYEGSCS